MANVQKPAVYQDTCDSDARRSSEDSLGMDFHKPLMDGYAETAWSMSNPVELAIPHKVSRKQSIARFFHTVLQCCRWILEAMLLVTMLVFLVKQPNSEVRELELGGDITGFAPRVSRQIKTFTPDPAFMPEDPAEFFTDDVNNHWLSIVPRGLGFVKMPHPENYNYLPAPLAGYNGTTYTTTLTHQLHCLHSLSNVVAAYWSNKLDKLPTDGFGHIAHCIDLLRQGIMCCGDTALEGQQTVAPKDVKGSDGWDAKHVCKDYGQILAHLDEHRENDELRI